MNLKFYIYGLCIMSSSLLMGQTQADRAKITSNYDRGKSAEVIRYLEEAHAEKQIRIQNYLKSLSIHQRSNIDVGAIREITLDGKPLYYTSHNSVSAQTIRVDRLNSDGDLGLNLNGQNMVAGVWEAGKGVPSFRHFDLNGRISYFDNDGNFELHATHIAGTIMSSGENSTPLNSGRGIAYEASVIAGTSDNDAAEMAEQAGLGLLVSNHAYGYLAEDLSLWQFGAYTDESYKFDLIAHTYPYYLPVVSVGNDRNIYVIINPTKDGYDLLSGNKIAKNVITTAAVDQVLSYSDSTSVVIANFSSWGPTDDGRIKPDISTQGTNVLSSSDSSNSAYKRLSGTSMASAATTGLLLLLQQHYHNMNSEYMLAATAKGLLLHTADEAGPYLGPDYKFGWGLANGEKAAQAISNTTVSSHIEESTLNDNESKTFYVKALGNEPLMVSMSWTDPEGVVVDELLDDRTPVLVNDLDVKMTRDGTDYFPWKLNAENPSAAATRNSTNDVDNFEKIEIDTPIVNGTYTVTIDHKGSLTNGSQNYSLIITGGIPVELDVSSFSVKEFVIFPNPSSGEFTIRLNSNVNSNDAIKVDVYDLSGRLIYNYTFDNDSAKFIKTINLTGVSSGVYIANITKGSAMTSQKIVIQ